jgi:23S rRNA (adenine2503-C2)-methyltransferase
MNLLDLTPDAAARMLTEWVAVRGEPSYRANQILRRLWQQPLGGWAEGTELPVHLRTALQEEFPISRPALTAQQVSSDGTVKFLWEFGDESVESVVIPDGRRRTLCISSQVGCAYGCVFCATGRMGFRRHLAAWEITAQVRELLLHPEFGRPNNVVFMGMGEPLHNWANVDRALTILNDPRGLGIGARQITVSTVGVLPNLAKLARRPEQFTVALSLHAADTETRARLMPVERKYPLADLLPALRDFRRRVTFEYVLVGGINDRPKDAAALAGLARPLGAHVNLLPLHPGGVPGCRPSPRIRMQQFATRLRELGIRTTLRRSRGLDISAACGQLRLETEGRPHVSSEDDGDVEQESGIRRSSNSPQAQRSPHTERTG